MAKTLVIHCPIGEYQVSGMPEEEVDVVRKNAITGRGGIAVFFEDNQELIIPQEAMGRCFFIVKEDTADDDAA